MKEKITARFVQTLKKSEKAYDVRDTDLNGFILRVYPSGKMTYMCDFRTRDGRRNRIAIGRVGVLTSSQARDEAIRILADVTNGIDPNQPEVSGSIPTFLGFLKGQYGEYLKTSLKSGSATFNELRSDHYFEFHQKRLNEISPFLIESYRMRRKKEGIALSTINRGVDRVRALCTKAVEWRVISVHPFKGQVRPYRVGNSKTRFLSAEEEARLRQALSERDQLYRQKRRAGNQWRKDRGYDLYHEYKGRYVDYLEPAVLLSLNLGMRRGELFGTRWDNVNLDKDKPEIFISSEISKSGKSRTLPLNPEALEVFQALADQCEKAEGPVFQGSKGDSLGEMKKSWARILRKAEIENFRWHDLRHTFASKLANAGLDLNIIRELLGHADMRMTLRYAHLAGNTLRAAVESLGSGKIGASANPGRANILK